MRTLKFNINGQLLEQDSKCDFDGIIIGTSNYLDAEFSFSDEWNDTVKVAEFRNHFNNETPISVPIKDNRCIVPDVTDTIAWRVCVVGKRGNVKLTTNNVRVMQKRR